MDALGPLYSLATCDGALCYSLPERRETLPAHKGCGPNLHGSGGVRSQSLVPSSDRVRQNGSFIWCHSPLTELMQDRELTAAPSEIPRLRVAAIRALSQMFPNP
jgi:hypothetical protein